MYHLCCGRAAGERGRSKKVSKERPWICARAAVKRREGGGRRKRRRRFVSYSTRLAGNRGRRGGSIANVHAVQCHARQGSAPSCARCARIPPRPILCRILFKISALFVPEKQSLQPARQICSRKAATAFEPETRLLWAVPIHTSKTVGWVHPVRRVQGSPTWQAGIWAPKPLTQRQRLSMPAVAPRRNPLIHRDMAYDKRASKLGGRAVTRPHKLKNVTRG